MHLLQVLGPLPDNILAYMDQWDGTTQVSIMVPSLTMVLSPATVRLILNSVRSLDVGSVSASLSLCRLSVHYYIRPSVCLSVSVSILMSLLTEYSLLVHPGILGT